MQRRFKIAISEPNYGRSGLIKNLRFRVRIFNCKLQFKVLILINNKYSILYTTVDSRYKPTPRDRKKGELITVGGLISDYFVKRIWLKGPVQGWAYNRDGLIKQWAYNESRLYNIPFRVQRPFLYFLSCLANLIAGPGSGKAKHFTLFSVDSSFLQLLFLKLTAFVEFLFRYSAPELCGRKLKQNHPEL